MPEKMEILSKEDKDYKSFTSKKLSLSQSSSNESNYERKPRNHRRQSSSSSSRSRKTRSRSHSSSRRTYKRRRYYGTREHPYESSILGVFGLSRSVNSDDLYHFFKSYGPVDNTQVIYDRATGNSRGFGFIYFRYRDDAAYARRKCNGMKLYGRRIRVDYSITKRAHTPTPGIYMGYHSKSNSHRRY